MLKQCTKVRRLELPPFFKSGTNQFHGGVFENTSVMVDFDAR